MWVMWLPCFASENMVYNYSVFGRARCTASWSHNCRWTQRCCESGYNLLPEKQQAGWDPVLVKFKGTTGKKVGDNSFFQSRSVERLQSLWVFLGLPR